MYFCVQGRTAEYRSNTYCYKPLQNTTRYKKLANCTTQQYSALKISTMQVSNRSISKVSYMMRGDHWDAKRDGGTRTCMFDNRNTWNISCIARSNPSDAEHKESTTFMFDSLNRWNVMQHLAGNNGQCVPTTRRINIFFTLQPHQLLRLPRQMTFVSPCERLW